MDLLPRLETTVRRTSGDEQRELHNLRARAYQATAAAFARQGESDAAWVAADRAVTAAEQSGDPLEVIAGMFRMPHACLRLQRFEQAERVTSSAIDALRPLTDRRDCSPQVLSLYGAMHLVQAVISARDGQRGAARERIQEARRVADRLGEDRNDFDTEFGPTNVQLHTVAVAADLGDAGEALDVAQEVDASGLSSERQARFLLDVARAHAQRRHSDRPPLLSPPRSAALGRPRPPAGGGDANRSRTRRRIYGDGSGPENRGLETSRSIPPPAKSGPSSPASSPVRAAGECHTGPTGLDPGSFGPGTWP